MENNNNDPKMITSWQLFLVLLSTILVLKVVLSILSQIIDSIL